MSKLFNRENLPAAKAPKPPFNSASIAKIGKAKSKARAVGRASRMYGAKP